jgi:hypothetical protein
MRRLVKDEPALEPEVADPGSAWMLRYQRGTSTPSTSSWKPIRPASTRS